jgi:hypothetical protein
MSSNDRIWQSNARCNLTDILVRSLREFFSLLRYALVLDSGSYPMQVPVAPCRVMYGRVLLKPPLLNDRPCLYQAMEIDSFS